MTLAEWFRLVEGWARAHPAAGLPALFALGAVVGSFLNVVIHRLPRDESIVRPRSRCPGCGAPIAWYDNIPLLSFAWLRARCRRCRAPISWRYPLVEALGGVLAASLWWRFGLDGPEWPVHFVFGCALIAISLIDFDHRIIPNEISLPGIALGFAASFLWPGFWVESLIGLAVGGGGLLLLSLVYALLRGREGMGMGDVKLLAMLGAWLGWKSLLFILLFASLQGVLVSVVLALAGVKLKPPLPEEEFEPDSPPGDGAAAAPDSASSEPPPAVGPVETVPGQPEPETPFLSAAIPFGPFLALSAIEYLFLAQTFYGWLGGR